jgi:chromate reductase, NAD(P)H dehydrogenase (quinone)
MITLIVGTHRNESNSSIVAAELADIIAEMGEETQVLNLNTLPKDFIFAEMFGNRSPQFEAISSQFIEQVDKFIFVIPEYNGGFPGVLKSFIDCLEPAHLQHKKAGMVGLSAGRAGSLRAMDQFTNVLHYLKVHVHFNKPKLSGFSSLISENRKITNSEALKNLNNFAEDFLKY